MPDHIIRIEPYGRTPKDRDIFRGYKNIVVDRKVWGIIEMRSGGRNGALYYFKTALKEDRIWRGGAIALVSTRQTINEKFLPLADRLINMARALVDEGLLRDPKIIVAEKHAKRIADRGAAYKRALKIDKMYRRRAVHALGSRISPTTLRRVINAMLWANRQAPKPRIRTK